MWSWPDEMHAPRLVPEHPHHGVQVNGPAEISFFVRRPALISFFFALKSDFYFTILSHFADGSSAQGLVFQK